MCGRFQAILLYIAIDFTFIGHVCIYIYIHWLNVVLIIVMLIITIIIIILVVFL